MVAKISDEIDQKQLIRIVTGAIKNVRDVHPSMSFKESIGSLSKRIAKGISDSVGSFRTKNEAKTESGLQKILLNAQAKVTTSEERVVNIDFNGLRIVSIYHDSKYAEFNSHFDFPSYHAESFREIVEYIRSQGYGTNLK